MSSSENNRNLIDVSALPAEEKLSEQRTKTLCDLLELYQCRPTPKLYNDFSPDACFEDPICDARNITEIKAQFNGMPKLFPVSINKQCKLIRNQPNETRIDLWQEYTLALVKKPILMKSLVVLNFDQNGKIINLEDRWDYKDSWRENNIWTYAQNALRRANAKLLPHFVNTD